MTPGPGSDQRTTPLPPDVVLSRLGAFPDWRSDGKTITRSVSLKGFARPLLLASAIGHLAETANHHPVLTVSYGSLAITLRTHDADGLTERDFALAAQIDALLDQGQA